MTDFSLYLAGQGFHISCQYPETLAFCKDYLLGQKEAISGGALIKIEVQNQDILYERKKSEAEDIKEGILIRHFTDEYLETLAVYRKIAEQIIDYDTILLHGSLIAVDGTGYLFTAKSGTGKSTHTRLWREQFGNRAVMVNDDKPLLHISKDGVTAYGTPWDGKHRLSTNIAVPLKAICILNRDATNHIERVSAKEAYPLILQQTYRSGNPVKMVQTLELLDRMMKHTKLYSLGCNMEPEAAMVSYEGMQK